MDSTYPGAYDDETAKERAVPTSMNISLPEPPKKLIDSTIRKGGYSGASAQTLKALISEGLASGAPVPADKKYWAAKRKQLRA